MNEQVTIKFTAQSGYVWQEMIDADDIDSVIAQQVKTHGDIERVEKLNSPSDVAGEVIWKME